MQIGGPVQGVSTIPRRRRLNALLAIVTIVLIAGMMALLIWAGALARSEARAEDAHPKAAGAGSAVIHDDAGNVHPKAGSVVKNTGIMRASMVKNASQAKSGVQKNMSQAARRPR